MTNDTTVSLPTVAVIGAGISGLAAARTLVDRGFDATVFDKGRGVGGRMSTRRTAVGRFDHGAQYFTARDERFRQRVDDWCDAGVVERWSGRVIELECGRVSQRASADRFVGVPGMNAICKRLAREVVVNTGKRVVSVRRDSTWQLAAEDQQLGEFDHLIVSIPAEQSAELLGERTELIAEIRAASLAPCWAAMFAFVDPVDFPADGIFVKNSPISWMCRDTSKPARLSSSECWVVHASADWSSQNIDRDADSVAGELLAQFFRELQVEPARPVHAVAHRWRYASPVHHLAEGFLQDQSQQLSICGDWCLGNRVEAAFLSGTAAAEALINQTCE